MLVFVICILTLQRVHSACNVPNLCTENPAIQGKIVDRHNAFRRAVLPTASDMLKMSWSAEVAASAQRSADTCTLKHGPPSSRMVGGYECGENLFMANLRHTWTAAVNAFHSEVRDYRYPNGSINGREIGHYTQVVWNSSYRVGCGVTLCRGSVYVYVCQYFRAGNFRGVAPYKAGPPCADCPHACEEKLCTNPCPYIDKYSNCPALKREAGCGNALVKTWCPAVCRCHSQIIPVGRR